MFGALRSLYFCLDEGSPTGRRLGRSRGEATNSTKILKLRAPVTARPRRQLPHWIVQSEEAPQVAWKQYKLCPLALLQSSQL